MYLPGLEWVRALAVMVVMAFHLNLPGFFDAGFLGVDIFFSLSGFLITSLLVKEYMETGHIGWQQFYKRRFWRLYPAIILLLLGCPVLISLIAPHAFKQFSQDLPAAILGISNWWQIYSNQSYFENFGHPPLLRHTWSLAVEMQYYLLWPGLLIVLLKRFGVKATGCASFAIATASAVWMGYQFEAGHGNINRAYLGTDTHCLSLLLGSGLACFWNPMKQGFQRSSWFNRPARIATSLMSLAGIVYCCWQFNQADPDLYPWGFLIASVCSLTLIQSCCDMKMIDCPAILHLPLQILNWIGKRSYSIYLWHWPLFTLLIGEKRPTLQLVALCFFLTLMAAEISFTLVEDRFKSVSLKTRSEKSRYIIAGVCLVMVLIGLVLGGKQIPVEEPGPVKETVPVKDEPVEKQSTDQEQDQEQEKKPIPAPLPQSASGLNIFAVGDSVMLGTKPELTHYFPQIDVDAEVGRQASQSLEVVHNFKRIKPQALDYAVIHLGTNGYIVESQFKSLLKEFENCKKILVINIFADRRWTDENNQLIERSVKDFPNVSLIDWNSLGKQHPEYFVKDGIHLTGKGIAAFVSEIDRRITQAQTQ
jgi:peptidoglycan/LPS O-acetylase OafA/YrhL